eukprot:CAMPEP_0179843738 /NCGR_PEP_ID=MMETSP0982-20121206/3891_1 /TAXON_ID=483367 /ORGANISM="non described non described, Strain CCMP 2436" /LENGTH=102 /DNA_ID=CAMNT_0021728239 /DNA_START=443 /DNA_END=751 /DNA_ORIENTATION=-
MGAPALIRLPTKASTNFVRFATAPDRCRSAAPRARSTGGACAQPHEASAYARRGLVAQHAALLPHAVPLHVPRARSRRDRAPVLIAPRASSQRELTPVFIAP